MDENTLVNGFKDSLRANKALLPTETKKLDVQITFDGNQQKVFGKFNEKKIKTIKISKSS